MWVQPSPVQHQDERSVKVNSLPFLSLEKNKTIKIASQQEKRRHTACLSSLTVPIFEACLPRLSEADSIIFLMVSTIAGGSVLRSESRHTQPYKNSPTETASNPERHLLQSTRQ